MSNEVSWYSKKENTSVFGLKLIIFCYKVFGLKFTLLIVWIIAFFVTISSRNIRKISKDYFTILEDYAKQKGVVLPKHNAFRHVYSFCKTMFFRILTWKGLISKEHFISNSNIEKFQELVNKQQGRIIISAHIGSIDSLRALVDKENAPLINIFMWTEQSQTFMNFLKSVNKDSALNIILTNEILPSDAIILKEKIDKGEWFGILADRVSSKNSRTVTVDFLGKKARFPQGPWILASLLKAQVTTLYQIETEQGIEVILNDLGSISLDRKNREESLRTYMQNFANELENILLKSPNSWYNFFDFWSDVDNSI
jgi:predicted LPLAT superfamily acyltransferase